MSRTNERHFSASASDNSSITGASWTIRKSITGLVAASSRPMMAPPLLPSTTAFLNPCVMHGTFTAKLATVKKDGSPHVVPIWFGTMTPVTFAANV